MDTPLTRTNLFGLDRQALREVVCAGWRKAVPGGESCGASLESALRALHEFEEQTRSPAAS